MTEAQLIDKIKGLKQIKPNQDWVVFTKSQLFDVKEIKTLNKKNLVLDIFPSLFSQQQWQFAFAVLALFVLSGGTFAIAQNSFPGDRLYPLRKLTERAQTVFVAKDDSTVNLEMANKRLEDLNKIAETNQVRNLAPAIEEFQANVAQAAKNLSQKREPVKTSPQVVKAIADQVKKLEENKKRVEQMGVVIGGTEELDNALASMVEREIQDLKNRTLTDEQKTALEQAEKYYSEKNYSKALEEIWRISNQ